MKFNHEKFRIVSLIIALVLLAIAFAMNNAEQKDFLEVARGLDPQPNPYVAETEAKEIKPASWDSVYLPSTVPEFYELGSSTKTDTYISCKFLRPIDYKKETSLDNSYPYIHFTQWNHKKETMPWMKSFLPPILKSGEFQTYGSQTYGPQTYGQRYRFEDEPEDQLKLKMNAAMQTQTYNGKEYYFYDETQNDNLLLLWYDEQNTFALSVEPGTGNKSDIEITLDEMLAIADSVEKYN